jgi:hypothetical protein
MLVQNIRNSLPRVASEITACRHISCGVDASFRFPLFKDSIFLQEQFGYNKKHVNIEYKRREKTEACHENARIKNAVKRVVINNLPEHPTS